MVSLGSFWAWGVFKSARAPRPVKVEMRAVPGTKDAVRTKPGAAVLNVPPAPTGVSRASAPSVSPPQNAEARIAVNPGSTPVKARIAIVIDDWGYHKSVLPLLYKIKSPVTIAVIPHLRFSKSIAREAGQRGYQVILHLPLESEGHLAVEKDTLNCSMSEHEIRQRLDGLLKSVPEIVGVNNHQGSKATKDTRIMGIIFSELHKNGLFFLDSRTTRRSVCPQTARDTGIKFAQSDGFIDLPPSRLDENEYQEYVRKNLERISAAAEKRGYAIMIGHDLEPTLDLLSREIPKMEQKGFKFVFLSELVRYTETTQAEKSR